MANATQVAVSDAALEVGAANGRLIGLLIVTLAPAVFWTALLGVIAWAFGYGFAPTVLAANFLAIATFLGIVFSALSFSAETSPAGKAR